MDREFNRDKFTKDFKQWLNENHEQVMNTCITVEDLMKDPDFINDPDFREESYEEDVYESKT